MKADGNLAELLRVVRETGERTGEARMLRRVKAHLRKTGWRSALLALKPLHKRPARTAKAAP